MENLNIKTTKELLEHVKNRVKEVAQVQIVDKCIKKNNKGNIELGKYFSDIIYMEYARKNKPRIRQYKATDNDIELINKALNDFENTHLPQFQAWHGEYRDKVKEAYSTIVKYKHNLRNNKEIREETGYMFDLEEQSSFESIGDMFNELHKFYSTVRFGKSLIKSYKHLFNDELLKKDKNLKYTSEEVDQLNLFSDNLELFHTIKEKKIDRKIIEDSLNKIASFKTSEDLKKALQKIVSLDKLNADKILSMVEEQDLNIEVVYNQDNKLAIIVNDYETSQALGSSSWCISYGESYYDDYLNAVDSSKTYQELSNDYPESYIQSNTHSNGSHIFYYDFNKDENDPMSKIAFTIVANGELTEAFDKNDNSIFDEVVQEVTQEVIDMCSKAGSVVDLEARNIQGYESLETLDDEQGGELLTHIYLEQRNPITHLSKLVEMLSDRGYYLNILKSDYEINKLYESQIQYEDIDNVEFIGKIFKIKNYLFDTKMSIELNENFDYDDYENVHVRDPSDIIDSYHFDKIYDKLSDVNKVILFKKHSEEFENLMNHERLAFHVDSYSNSNFINKKYLLEYFSKTFDGKEQSSRNDEFTKSCVFKNIKINEKTKNYFLDMTKENRFNINILLENINNIDQSLIKPVIEIINNNPDEYFNWKMKSKAFHEMSKNKEFVEGLTQESISSLSKNIELSDMKIRKDTPYKENTTFEYPDRMKYMFDKGIINKEIIENNFDMFSGMSMHEESILKKETGMSLKDYVSSSIIINQKLKKPKLK